MAWPPSTPTTNFTTRNDLTHRRTASISSDLILSLSSSQNHLLQGLTPMGNLAVQQQLSLAICKMLVFCLCVSVRVDIIPTLARTLPVDSLKRRSEG